MTVYFGQRKGSASSTDLSAQAVKETVAAACRFLKCGRCRPHARQQIRPRPGRL
ncbi:MAG: hypothetical protein ACOYMH_14945, partial [Zwartia sp.]